MINGSKEQYDRDLHGTPIDFIIEKSVIISTSIRTIFQY